MHTGTVAKRLRPANHWQRKIMFTIKAQGTSGVPNGYHEGQTLLVLKSRGWLLDGELTPAGLAELERPWKPPVKSRAHQAVDARVAATMRSLMQEKA